MGLSYKNFWALNIDEAVVTGILRGYFKRRAEVFMPLNAQLRDVDLLIVNLKNGGTVTIQVKGSRAFEPKTKEKERFGHGSGGWFFIKKESIRDCSANYFIFLVYVINEKEKRGRRYIEPHIITISPSKLYKLCKEKKILHTRYSFYIWINPKKKKAFDFRDEKKKGIVNLDKYLDGKGLNQILKFLKI